jgi:hypothetical protein
VISAATVTGFLRPFFEAIYVTPLVRQSSACFRFVLRMLAEGSTSLPDRGMQAVPDQLAETCWFLNVFGCFWFLKLLSFQFVHY